MDKSHDQVNHPPHYAAVPSDVECIDVARHLPYNLGCAFKYVWRADKKDSKAYGLDLEKAIWYLDDFIFHIQGYRMDFSASAAVMRTINACAMETARRKTLELIALGLAAGAVKTIREELLAQQQEGKDAEP